MIWTQKEKGIKPQAIGKNTHECQLLLQYVASKGFGKSVSTNTVTFNANRDSINELISYLKEEWSQELTVTERKINIYKIIGYNGDEITLTFFPSTNKGMVQGRPFFAYSIVSTFLASNKNFTFEQIVDFNNAFVGINTPSSTIRDEIIKSLGPVYDFLDEALKKSISGSFSLFNQKCSEDYTGCLTGIFKALEGYLKKIMDKKFGYTFHRNGAFSMFCESQGPSEVDKDSKIPEFIKVQLKKLYSLYKNKRNVYLHATINPFQTRIIASYKEAREIADELLCNIKESYEIIFVN